MLEIEGKFILIGCDLCGCWTAISPDETSRILDTPSGWLYPSFIIFKKIYFNYFEEADKTYCSACLYHYIFDSNLPVISDKIKLSFFHNVYMKWNKNISEQEAGLV